MRSLLTVAGVLLPMSAAMAEGPPHNPQPEADQAVMALARKAIGTTCHFSDATYGPQAPGFTNLKGVGQTLHDGGTIVVRQHGGQRVAFLASITDKDCRFLDVQPLPARSAGEDFLQCRVDDPDPNKNAPLSDGLGLRQRKVKGLAAYLEADLKGRHLLPRAGDDARIKCSGFEAATDRHPRCAVRTAAPERAGLQDRVDRPARARAATERVVQRTGYTLSPGALAKRVTHGPHPAQRGPGRA